jgi:basic membrane lipoprotein Med (substrate-binding protein (PBP1-ABC) superfamily)
MAMITSVNEARMEYEKALRIGKREGGCPDVLDDILKEKNIMSVQGIPLGVVQIPMDQIAGTKSAGRSSAFSKNFYPLLKPDSEFGSKWISLYRSHIDEGIREPVKAYEYMNKFYIEEGNKRVSVLRYLGAVSVPGNVIRIVPPRSQDKDVQIYYQYMAFYELSGVNYIWFSQDGSFAKLQYLMGKRPDEVWTDDDKMNFSSLYTHFTDAFKEKGGEKLGVLPGDAFLSFISLYDYDTVRHMSMTELNDKLKKFWSEFQLLKTDDSVELQMQPTEEKELKKNINIFERLFPATIPKQKVAFINLKTAKTSSWTYAHELGRMHLEEAFSDQVSTVHYDHATEECGYDLLEEAIEEGSNLIFTTSSVLLKPAVQAAIEHPEVKILNCSLNTSYRHIRTYYARMYEAKFLMGAIAGAMAENDRVGYIADYPIFGTIANINAYALGAKLVNPRVKVYLEWSTMKDHHDVEQTFRDHQVRYISGRDIIAPGKANRQFGLYMADEERPWNLAMPVWHWGKFYEQMIRNIMDGSWKYDDASDTSKGLNYWWGMSAGMVDVILSHHLPIGTNRLIHLLKKEICEDGLNPFSGVLYSQEGIVQKDEEKSLSPEEIINMNWLAENVIGDIPDMELLEDRNKLVVSIPDL